MREPARGIEPPTLRSGAAKRYFFVSAFLAMNPEVPT
jgi:hypothetical protein